VVPQFVYTGTDDIEDGDDDDQHQSELNLGFAVVVGMGGWVIRLLCQPAGIRGRGFARPVGLIVLGVGAGRLRVTSCARLVLKVVDIGFVRGARFIPERFTARGHCTISYELEHRVFACSCFKNWTCHGL